MQQVHPRVIPIRRGEVQPQGSWLYIWVDISDGSIAYVGATGFEPELRAYLHLRSDNPDVGRVRATVPGFDERDFDVLAFELPIDCPRPVVKQASRDRLADAPVTGPRTVAHADAMSAIVEPIVDVVLKYSSARSSTGGGHVTRTD